MLRRQRLRKVTSSQSAAAHLPAALPSEQRFAYNTYDVERALQYEASEGCVNCKVSGNQPQ